MQEDSKAGVWKTIMKSKKNSAPDNGNSNIIENPVNDGIGSAAGGLNDEAAEYGGAGANAEAAAAAKPGKPRRALRITCIILSVVIVLGVVAGVVCGLAFCSQSTIEDIEEDIFQTISLDLPTDGSTPMNHTGVENIGYMNKKLHSQPYYYAETTGSVEMGSLGQQDIKTYKQYYDGVLISADITKSGIVNSAKQFCCVQDRVIWRDGGTDSSTYNGLDTEYSTGDPEGNVTIEDFKSLRGFPPSEFSVYILNSETILSCDDVVDNGDETYSQTFHLKVTLDEEDPEDAPTAVYYYRQQMNATSGFNIYPSFQSAQVTYTFDKNWQVLKAESSESYKMTIVSCTGESTIEFKYDEDLCKNTAYENYFAQYIADSTDSQE